MFRDLFRLFRPLHLLLAALTYVFGASIANYLGKPFRLDSFWLGLGAVLLAQMSMSLLSEVFRLDAEPLEEGETRRERQTLRNNALYISVAALAADAVIAFILYYNQRLVFASLVFIFLSLLFVLAYSVSPFRLVSRGFGELTLALHLAYIIPSIAFLLQASEYNRLLALMLPLTALAFAYFIILGFPAFATDRKLGRRTLLVLLGWERVVPLHHSLILFAYLLFAASPALGLSLTLIWPAFLTLPFAILQILLLRNISLGARPNWTLLTVTALAVFGLTAYFLTLTFWLR